MARLDAASPKRRTRGGDFLAILLLLAFVAGMGWLWWQDKQSHKKSVKPETPASQPVLNLKHQPIVPSLVLVHRQPEMPGKTNIQNSEMPAPVSPPPVVPPVTTVAASNAPVLPPPVIPVVKPDYPRPVRNVLEAQVALARQAISPGCIDGAVGSQTRAALVVFQRLLGLEASRVLDTNTETALQLDEPLFTEYVATTNDLARLQPLGKTWLAKSEQSALEYESILELVAEKAHSSQALIKTLNPTVNWNDVPAGTALKIPQVIYPDPSDRAAWVVIHLSDRFLEAFDTASNLIAHFPCSIAAKMDKRPVGELHVSSVVPHPNYTFDPAIFAESPEAQAIGHKLVLPPGPNNPVGVAWIGLDKPGYGMHGTPGPEQIGRTESHGCFRLANWDAEYLLKLVWIGMPVYVEP